MNSEQRESQNKGNLHYFEYGNRSRKEGASVEKLGLTGKSKHSTDETMRGLSAVLVDGDEIFIDNGAIHAKSRIERGITFVKTKDEVPNPRFIQGFWITLHRFEHGQGYYGAMPFGLYIDANAQQGYKSLAEQVNGMDKVVKGNVAVASVDATVRSRVAQFLQRVRPDLWDHAAPAFKQGFNDNGAADGVGDLKS